MSCSNKDPLCNRSLSFVAEKIVPPDDMISYHEGRRRYEGREVKRV